MKWEVEKLLEQFLESDYYLYVDDGGNIIVARGHVDICDFDYLGVNE